MHPDEPHPTERDPYELLRRLRRAERRIRAIHRRWRAFREDPDPVRLARVRRRLERAAAELDALGRALDASRPSPPGPARVAAGPPASGRPSPRDVVDAGRDLDAAVGEAVREWHACRRAPSALALERVLGRLREAASASGTLVAALAPLGERGSGTGDPGPRARRGSSAPNVERREEAALDDGPPATLDALLAELRAEWSDIRRHPTHARAVELEATIESASIQAASLLALATSGSPLAAPDALRYLAGAGDSVRFRPYRDASTGAYNEQGFLVAAGVELDRCRRYGRPLGLLLLTLEAGADDVRPIVGAMRELLRDYDVVGRVSELELAIVLPESDARGTRRIAARLLRALDAAGRRKAVRRLDYATTPGDADGIESLLAAARARGAR